MSGQIKPVYLCRIKKHCLLIDKTIALLVFPFISASNYNMRLSATNSQRHTRNIVQTNNNIVQETKLNIPHPACFCSILLVLRHRHYSSRKQSLSFRNSRQINAVRFELFTKPLYIFQVLV